MKARIGGARTSGLIADNLIVVLIKWMWSVACCHGVLRTNDLFLDGCVSTLIRCVAVIGAYASASALSNDLYNHQKNQRDMCRCSEG